MLADRTLGESQLAGRLLRRPLLRGSALLVEPSAGGLHAQFIALSDGAPMGTVPQAAATPPLYFCSQRAGRRGPLGITAFLGMSRLALSASCS